MTIDTITKEECLRRRLIVQQSYIKELSGLEKLRDMYLNDLKCKPEADQIKSVDILKKELVLIENYIQLLKSSAEKIYKERVLDFAPKDFDKKLF